MKTAIILILLAGVAFSQDVLLKKVYYTTPAADYTGLFFPDSLTYLGAFRVPDGTLGESRFGYSNGRIGFNTKGDTSLFFSGHSTIQRVAEIDIPTLVIDADYTNLNTATMIYNFYDVRDTISWANYFDTPYRIGGMAVVSDTLVTSWYETYDASMNSTHGFQLAGLDLSLTSDAVGPFDIGDPLNIAYYAGYIADIPSPWSTTFSATHAIGNASLSIAGRTSAGPAAFVTEFPDSLIADSTTVANPLVYYTVANPLDNPGETSDRYNNITQITGVFFYKSSLVFFGRHGTGELCYGTGGEAGDCYDPAYTAKGYHAWPYHYYYWAYRLTDCQNVFNGTVNPWDITPYSYGVWGDAANDTLRFQRASLKADPGGVAYDSAGNRLFVVQNEVDLVGEPKPIVHVYQEKSLP